MLQRREFLCGRLFASLDTWKGVHCSLLSTRQQGPDMSEL